MFATSHNMQAGSSDHQIPAARAATFTYKALRAALPLTPVYSLWQSPQEKSAATEAAAPAPSPKFFRRQWCF